MFRFRRYRVFLVFAVFAVGLLYHSFNVQDWKEPRPGSVDGLIKYNQQTTAAITPATKDAVPDTTQRSTSIAAVSESSTSPSPSLPPVATTVPKVDDDATTTPTSTLQKTDPLLLATPLTQPTIAPIVSPLPTPKNIVGLPKAGDLLPGGEGRHEVPPPLKSASAIHWIRLPEHFPVPSESLIHLPTAKPSPIPKIQHAFTDETPSARSDRESKLTAIREAFRFSWTEYKSPNSWLHDELAPVSGGARDPFCGWAATLVDSLDTLWIMGMEDEFKSAAATVGQIDFTTSIRNDIPLFETTIRYLGGLLSSYELSGAKYNVLLEKAVELASVLMGAFDTPNRMPITYYYWKPTFATQPHRAGTRTVLAELGSLSMEFTKLAQLTQDTRYYDAVARITDELHAWQNNTKIPGLWPTFVDTSGCRKSELGSDPMLQHSLSHGPHSHVGDSLAVGATSSNPTDPVIPNSPATPQPGTIAEAVYASPSPQPSPAVPVTNAEAASLSKARRDAAGEVELNAHLKRRQLAIDTLEKPAPPAEAPAVTPKQPDQAQGANAIPKPLPLLPKLQQTISKVNCEAQGIGSPPGEQREHFSLGAMADSTYEYLPKQFLLLGGQVSQYKTMYERAIAAASKYLLFRPMVPGSEDILVMGQATTSGNPDVPGNLRLDPQQEHLLCFTGGMYALGSKIFNRPEDLSIAAKLTNGCVWGYKSTATGIMPESFQLLPCESLTGCEWNKTAYYEALDPYQATREETQIQAQKWQEERKAQAKKVAAQAAEAALASQQEAQQSTPSPVAVAGETVHTEGPLAKRQLGNVDNVLPASELQVSVPPGGTATSAGGGSILDGVPDKITYPSHEEFVEDRIANERIPPGFTQINSKKYILRPEAIESVFIMYRITGDETWREKGWTMFNAIQQHTRAVHGYSAIGDVTMNPTFQLDAMESFWLAETLKYFYLLFSPPDLISLDDYVFNTEAHPFKRPK